MQFVPVTPEEMISDLPECLRDLTTGAIEIAWRWFNGLYTESEVIAEATPEEAERILNYTER
jgi:hypothetical protein